MSDYQITSEAAEADFLACAAYLAERIKSADGHAEALKEIVPRYLAKNDVDRAAEFANAVDDPFVRDRLLAAAAEKCAAIDDDEYAAQLVEAIEDFGMQAQATERSASQKAARGDFAKALEIAGALAHPDFVLGDIAAQQAAGGDEAGAFETLARIEFPNAKTVAYQNIAHRHLEKGDRARAAALIERAEAAANDIELIEEKAAALVDIGNHYVEAGANGKAVAAFDRAKTFAETIDNQHRDRILAGAALGFLNAGSLELADRALDLVTDNVQIADTLHGYAQHFRRKNEPGEAVEILEEAYAILKSQKERAVRDSRRRFSAWAAIAVEFARLEKNERALEIAQEIPDESAQTGALNQIAQICAAQNKNELARQTVNAVTDDASRMFALLGISDQKLAAEKPDEALNYLREAETLSETVPQIASRSAALNELARRFQDLNETDKARELLGENLRLIATIRDASSRSVALAHLSDFAEPLNYEPKEADKEILRTLIRQAER